MLEINRANRLSQDCDHFVTDLASLLTDHRKSGRPILAKYKHFKTTCEQKCDNSPVIPNPSFVILVIVQARTRNLMQLLCLFVGQFAVPFHTFFAHVLPRRTTMQKLLIVASPIPAIFLLLQQKYVLQTYFCFIQFFCHFVRFPAGCIPVFHDQEMMSVPQYRRSSSVSHTREPNSACFQPFCCRPHGPTRITPVFCEQTGIPNLSPFPNPSSRSDFSNCLSHKLPASGCPFLLRSKETMGSTMLFHDCGHLCFGRCVQTSGHSHFGMLSIFGASSIFYLGTSGYCVCRVSVAFR